MRVPSPDTFLDHFAAIVLGHVEREFPNKLDHVMNGPEESLTPRQLHPIFYGSYDWHSCVHGHWLLVRALRLSRTLFRDVPTVAALLDRNFTPANVEAEVAYLRQKSRGTFERTYGWAWLLKLGAELRIAAAERTDDPELAAAMGRWDRTLEPLTRAFVDRYLAYLPKATYPIRVGTHNNSAFAITLSLDYARAADDAALTKALTSKALAWYSADINCPAWEPDGTDFISPSLMEAECMRRVLPRAEFLEWFGRFLPRIAACEPTPLFVPAIVSDRTDGQITHLDGLNLSRAWCWRALAETFAADDPRKAVAASAFQTHLDAALAHVTGDYMGEHWLATFALLAISESTEATRAR